MKISSAPEAAAAKITNVVVSILNWNNASATLTCVRSLLLSILKDFDMRVVVVDNGSDIHDWMVLRKGLEQENVRLIRLDTNIGFAAGHNRVMREAVSEGADCVWLVNNDTWIPAGTLQALIHFMDADPTCGATSPVIRALHDSNIVDFCGACHDRKNLRKIIPAEIDKSRQLEVENTFQMSLYGTALMLRTTALKEIGLLNEDYFAYYEDDDISRRLSRNGWKNRICFDALIYHRHTTDNYTERPAYYFYLMSRNEMFFWTQGAQGRFCIKKVRMRLITRSLIRAARLRSRGMREKSEACLLGIHHGLIQRGGAPALEVSPPMWMQVASRYIPRIILKCFT